MWIELHDNLPDHPKIVKLSVIMKIDRDLARAKLERLWLWALTNRLDGNLSEDDVLLLTDVMRLKGPQQTETMVDALVQCKLLDRVDGGYIIHDWYDHVGRLVERKEEQKAYNKRKTALYNDLRLTKAVKERDGDICQYCGKTVNWKDRKGCDGGTYDHIDPDGDNSLENLCVACRSCNSSKRGRTPWEANMPFVEESALWQIYGRYFNQNQADSGRFQADKSIQKSAITVPKPNNIDIDPTTRIERAREDAKVIHNLSTDDRMTANAVYCLVMAEEPTQADVDALAGWVPIMDKGLIQYALELACLYGADNAAAYACAVLGDWYRLHIRTVEAARAWREERA